MSNKKKKKLTNSKNNNIQSKTNDVSNVDLIASATETTDEKTTQIQLKNAEKADKKLKTQAKKDAQSKQKNKKPKKEKSTPKLVKKVKETTSELKKVTWPSFKVVVKKTGVVLTVVLVFGLVLFGIDRLLAWLFEMLTSSIAV